MRLPIDFSGWRIRQLMRLHRVTIREIATEYCITLERVRQVRTEGGPWDWPLMIEELSKRECHDPDKAEHIKREARS